jgi:hypothetical protein
VDANIITQKEDRFDRRVRENFHKVNEKMGYEEFRLFSLIFGYFRLFSAIFAYFQNRFIK